MAKKQKKVIETEASIEKKEAVVSEPKSGISTLEEATELVEKSYKTPLVLEYVVLENGHVFYGINKNVALKYARKFGLKVFDVELK